MYLSMIRLSVQYMSISFCRLIVLSISSVTLLIFCLVLSIVEKKKEMLKSKLLFCIHLFLLLIWLIIFLHTFCSPVICCMNVYLGFLLRDLLQDSGSIFFLSFSSYKCCATSFWLPQFPVIKSLSFELFFVKILFIFCCFQLFLFRYDGVGMYFLGFPQEVY